MVDGITIEDIYGGFHTLSPMYIENIFMYLVDDDEDNGPYWVGVIRTQSGMSIEVFTIEDEQEASETYKTVIGLFQVVKH